MSMLPCISIRQPWAWLVVNGYKDIENRSWRTKFRGRILIHAAKAMTDEEWLDAMLFATRRCQLPQSVVDNARDEVASQRGGIVGSVEIVDCVDGHRSPWFVGDYGFVLRDARKLPFIPLRGALSIFGVPESVVAQ